ncbi:MAG: hypothetical protein PHR77_14770 [Kiritimatiellae bacterium]|nr:hypothetical protein [Kiritimatiellia bacterium]MDD5520680.1 hypothetical protein [Kiritimatiellia bacterium]
MRHYTPLVIALFLGICLTRLSLGAISGSISSESLTAAPPVESISFGFNYDGGKRQVKDNSDNITELEARSYSFFLGYDASKWCTLFATLGMSEARLSDKDEFGDAKVKWSIGINANIWHIDLEEPPLFSGRISIRPALEYSQFNSGIDDETIKWRDISGTLLLSYEKIIEDPKYNITEFYGYAIYAGPVFSIIDGSIGDNVDFNEDTSLGLVGGLDFFIRRNLSVGGQIQSFDELSFGGNFRYHF